MSINSIFNSLSFYFLILGLYSWTLKESTLSGDTHMHEWVSFVYHIFAIEYYKTLQTDS